MVEDAWQYMLNATAVRESKLFDMDLVDVTRQALQNKAEDMYTVIMQAYSHGEEEAVRVMGDSFIELLNDIDRILATHSNFLLGKWLEAAKTMARHHSDRDDDMEDLFEMNARAQITTWGPNGEIVDYATKQWSGMFRDFFAPRWRVFFDEMLRAMRMNRKMNSQKVAKKILYTVEIPFISANKLYPDVPSGESPRSVSRELYDKWANNLVHLGTREPTPTVYLVP